MDASDVVRRRWRAREAPDGDFVVFGDGSIVVMELVCFRPPGGWRWIEVLRAGQWSASEWVDVDCVLASHTGAGRHALAGESAAHGSIGWVALTRDGDGAGLEWLAISRSSNPFAAVTVDDATVTAVSTVGRVWAFPRHAPERVAIT
jgi:hypothetical protein